MIQGIVVRNSDNKIKGELAAATQESIVASTPDGCTFHENVEFDRDRIKFAFYDGTTVSYTKTELEVQSELSVHNLRQQRDELLLRSDWTQANDAPLTEEQKQSWRTYRQALRDLPANTVDPSSPVFPDAPS